MLKILVLSVLALISLVVAADCLYNDQGLNSALWGSTGVLFAFFAVAN